MLPSMINVKQITVLFIALLTVIAMGIFPPWESWKDSAGASPETDFHHFAGYFPVWAPPQPQVLNQLGYGVSVYVIILALQVLIVAGLAYFLFQKFKDTANK